MALIECPECGGQISDRAWMCPKCGFSKRGQMTGFDFEYKSNRRVFGLPLVHVVLGYPFDLQTGKPRVAKGIIAIGGVSVGVLSFGGLAVGVISFGGLALGLAAFGGCAVALLLAVGGMAVGLVAIGGGALGYYSLGGGAWGVHKLGANAQDPGAIEFFKQFLGAGVEKFGKK